MGPRQEHPSALTSDPPLQAHPPYHSRQDLSLGPEPPTCQNGWPARIHLCALLSSPGYAWPPCPAFHTSAGDPAQVFRHSEHFTGLPPSTPLTFLASAAALSFGLGGGDSSKKRTSSPSEMPLPSLGTRGAVVLSNLGNSAPIRGDWAADCRDEHGTAGLWTSLEL